MSKKFIEIREAVNKKTKVPGSTAAVANQRLSKVVGYNRGHQPGPNKGQYKMNHVPPNHNQVSTTAKSTKPKTFKAFGMNEDGVGGGAVMSAGNAGFSNAASAKGPVAGFDVPMGKKRLSFLRRKKPQ